MHMEERCYSMTKVFIVDFPFRRNVIRLLFKKSKRRFEQPAYEANESCVVCRAASILVTENESQFPVHHTTLKRQVNIYSTILLF